MSKFLQHHRTVYVSEENLDPPLTQCPVCHETGTRKFVAHIQEDPTVDYLECQTCRACSVSRMPSREYLDRYYSNYYGDKDELITFSGIERFSRHVAEFLPVFKMSREISILDFGGGDGSLSQGVAKQFLGGRTRKVNITVVDFVDPQPSDNKSISINSVRSLEDVEGQFDLLLASAVFEHIPDLHHILVKSFGLIKAGGYLYARTPYALPFKKLTPRFDIFFPMHVHDLGSFFWNRFLSNLNFSGSILHSRPSIVETEFSTDPLKRLLAYLFKMPAHLEITIRGRTPDLLLWPFVGGWEVVIQKD